jgi:3-methyladenine DNA glycosylase AlkD
MLKKKTKQIPKSALTYDQVIEKLFKLQNKKNIYFKREKFGIIANNSLGIYHKELKEIAKDIGKNNELAIKFFNCGIYEARILCSMIFSPKELTERQMEKWVRTFENWEICDSFCMGVFAKSDFAVKKAIEWSTRNGEFEKRAAFVIMASYCMAEKNAPNKVFEQFFPIIIKEAHDERLYVKKAVNWALRNIGKRNIDLQKKSLKIADKILKLDTDSTKWIARDAIRELTNANVNILDYPRAKYRKLRK